MKTFSEFVLITEKKHYDAEFMAGASVRGPQEGGRIGKKRKKRKEERRRMKAIGGGQVAPVEYKERKDIGQQKKTETRVQQPTQERGSAEVRERAAAAAKEERRKAALARKAAREGGGQAASTQTPQRERDLSRQASQLLTKAKPKQEVHPDYKPQKASGMTRQERMGVHRKGETALRAIMKDQEIKKYKEATGQNPTGSAMTKILAHVHKRMAN